MKASCEFYVLNTRYLHLYVVSNEKVTQIINLVLPRLEDASASVRTKFPCFACFILLAL